MSNLRRKIKLVIMPIVAVFILLMSNYSLAENAYTVNLSSTTDVIGVQNDVSRFTQSNAPIYFETLKDNRGLFCNGHGIALPSRLSNSYPTKDATLNTHGINVEIDQLRESNKIQRNPMYAYTKTQPDATNPYGSNGSVVTTTRTQALYNNKGLKDLSPREAYVLAHQKDTSTYPDPTQLAFWGVTKYVPGASLSNENTTVSPTNREIAKNLYNEAIAYEEAVKKLEEFKNNNNGKEIVDKTDYSNVHPGYNKLTGKYIVGPFTWDYVRAYYVPSNQGQSQTVNEDGVVSFSGISDIKWYADDGKTLEIKNVNYVYDEQRNLGSGDEKYKYPYPNQPFYIEFSKSENPQVKAVSKASINLDIMKAEGQAYDIEGTFNDINWVAKDDPIICKNTFPVCKHGLPYHVQQYGTTSVPCPLLYCSIHRDKFLGDGHLQGHDFYIEGQIANQGVTGQPQKAVPSSKITVQNYVPEMEVGEPVNYPGVIPFPIGIPREDEYIEVPVLPEEPVNPNEPDNPNKPDEPNKPDNPDNPDTPDNPYEPDNPCIPLIMEIAGEVWIDNPTGKESVANGVRDEGEEGKQNVEVYLYNVQNDSNPVMKTITDSDGKYSFAYVEVGEEYYVEFVYDGMTYKTTKYLNSQLTESEKSNLTDINTPYIEKPENYLKASHAIENILERDNFNSKFNIISNNMATSVTGMQTPLHYYNVVSTQGTMSSLITTDSEYMTLPAFKMSARTSNTGLIYPLDNSYYVDTKDLKLPTQNGQEYNYIRTYEGLKHINLGLVKREQGDFAVKNDAYQTTLTIKGDCFSFEHNSKTTNVYTYDANRRTAAYYTDKQYTQLLDKSDYEWKSGSDPVYNESDELNVYIEYKFLIRNQSTLEWGNIKELTNYFDKDLKYSTSYYHTNMTSWIETQMNGSEEKQKEPINWEYGPDKDGFSSIYTDDLADIIMVSGDTIEIHLILQVGKDAARNIILNNDSNPNYDNILEITKYSVNEGLIDRDSNPGSSKLNDTKTYEDDTDNAPFIQIKLDDSEEAKFGNVISGNVFEDLKSTDSTLVNNMYTGNGVRDDNEKGIPNVKVELVEVFMNKSKGQQTELLTGKETRTDENGNYNFTNLPTGTYKVKFTYGDEYQLQKDTKYNGQDYKSVSTDTLKQQYENNPLEVMILIDTSEGMQYNKRLYNIQSASKQLVNSIYNKVQKAKVGIAFFSEPESNGVSSTAIVEKPSSNELINALSRDYNNDGANLGDTISDALGRYTNSQNSAKVMIILTDGYMEDSEHDKEMIEVAKSQGVQVITILCTTDEWSEDTFGTEFNSVPDKLYCISDTYLAQYIEEIALEDTLFEFEKILPNLTDAKDVQTEYIASNDSNIGDIHTRKQNIEYTHVMVNENGQIVDGKDSSNISEFAKNTQMTAITPIRNVTLYHNNYRTADTNLGLIERPQVELQIKEEIASYKITLANGTVIIDSEKGAIQNVLDLSDKKVIHLDNEIMQGATLSVKYKITVFNNGQVDTLGEYYDYDMFNKEDVDKYTKTVPLKIGTLYNYYDKLTFRAEENNRMPIEINRPNSTNENGEPTLLETTLVWQQKNDIATAADVNDKIKKAQIQVVSTNTLKDIELYPAISKEVSNNNLLTSVSTYIQFSKVLSANDSSDTLNYNNAVEIVERISDVGRRDYIGVPGNYVPFEDITEYDSARAENISILNPFGLGRTYFNYI